MKALVATFLLVANTVSAATLQIVQPAERAVFQRDAHGTAAIPVTCMVTNGVADGIEVRAINRQTNVLAKDWAKITTGGKLALPAGWYRIELRAKKAGSLVATGTVERVGVGEVFVTCGQSNSANHGQPPQKAQDDRVSSCDFQTSQWQHADDPQPGATGNGGSPWPILGDLFAKKYDVPVGFICVGVGGTPVSYWIPTQGKDDPLAKKATALIAAAPPQPYHARFIQDIGKGYPRVRQALEAAGAHGVRAVLWHQGESDSALGTSTDDYAAMLSRCIRQSRTDAGWDVPWGVALIGWNPSPDATAARQAAIVAGQKKVIATVPGVFQGPATDSFHEHGWLCDSVHFNAQGLTAHAQGWADALAPVIGKKSGRLP